MTKPISVLLIDDNATFLRIAARFLGDHGDIRVVGTAAGGEEGLKLAKKLKPQIILLDLAMPDVPGLDAIPLLREILPEVKLIVLTMVDTDAYRKAAKTAGADGFIAKASMGANLLSSIRSLSTNHNHKVED
jgi:DNA-binding NarL/FixJ family response regulator